MGESCAAACNYSALLSSFMMMYLLIIKNKVVHNISRDFLGLATAKEYGVRIIEGTRVFVLFGFVCVG